MDSVKTNRACPKCGTEFGGVADRCRCPACGHWFNRSEVEAAAEEERLEAQRKSLASEWRNRKPDQNLPTRAEFAGFKPKFSVAAVIGAYQSDIESSASLSTRVHAALQLLTLYHFGLFDGDTLEVAQKGINYAHQELERGEGARFDVYSTGLLLSLLTDSETAALDLSRSLKLPCELDYMPLIPWEIQTIHQLIAARLTVNSDVIESSKATLTTSKRGRGKLYSEAFLALVDDDCKTFHKRLWRALTLFAARKKPTLDATYPTEWISMIASALFLMDTNGCAKVSELPHHLSALVLTRQSTGIRG